MKKNTKKTASKAKGPKATKNLDVKPAKGAKVRGGTVNKGWIEVSSFSFNAEPTVSVTAKKPS